MSESPAGVSGGFIAAQRSFVEPNRLHASSAVNYDRRMAIAYILLAAFFAWRVVISAIRSALPDSYFDSGYQAYLLLDLLYVAGTAMLVIAFALVPSPRRALASTIAAAAGVLELLLRNTIAPFELTSGSLFWLLAAVPAIVAYAGWLLLRERPWPPLALGIVFLFLNAPPPIVVAIVAVAVTWVARVFAAWRATRT